MSTTVWYNPGTLVIKMTVTSVGRLGLMLAGTAALAGFTSAVPTDVTTQRRAPFEKGSFVIDKFQLYPENAKWDPVRRVVYFGYETSA